MALNFFPSQLFILFLNFLFLFPSFQVQWQQHDGKCGECGDEYTPNRPRNNENGGHYGTGVIAKE